MEKSQTFKKKCKHRQKFQKPHDDLEMGPGPNGRARAGAKNRKIRQKHMFFEK